jgi:hypothetical protein
MEPSGVAVGVLAPLLSDGGVLVSSGCSLMSVKESTTTESRKSYEMLARMDVEVQPIIETNLP